MACRTAGAVMPSSRNSYDALLYVTGVNVREGRFPTYVYCSEVVTMIFSAIVTALSIGIFAPFRK